MRQRLLFIVEASVIFKYLSLADTQVLSIRDR